LCSGGFEFDAMGAGNKLLNLGRFVEGKGLVLSSGLPPKVTMVMMTLLAFPHREACRFVLGSFFGS